MSILNTAACTVAPKSLRGAGRWHLKTAGNILLMICGFGQHYNRIMTSGSSFCIIVHYEGLCVSIKWKAT